MAQMEVAVYQSYHQRSPDIPLQSLYLFETYLLCQLHFSMCPEGYLCFEKP